MFSRDPLVDDIALDETSTHQTACSHSFLRPSALSTMRTNRADYTVNNTSITTSNTASTPASMASPSPG